MGLGGDLSPRGGVADSHLPWALRQMTAWPCTASMTSRCSPAVSGRSARRALGTERSALAVPSTRISLWYCRAGSSQLLVWVGVQPLQGEGGRDFRMGYRGITWLEGTSKIIESNPHPNASTRPWHLLPHPSLF